jgi:hypothetical protein
MPALQYIFTLHIKTSHNSRPVHRVNHRLQNYKTYVRYLSSFTSAKTNFLVLDPYSTPGFKPFSKTYKKEHLLLTIAQFCQDNCLSGKSKGKKISIVKREKKRNAFLVPAFVTQKTSEV